MKSLAIIALITFFLVISFIMCTPAAFAISFSDIQKRPVVWKTGDGGFIPFYPQVFEFTPLDRTLIPEAWMVSPHITVKGVPFEIPQAKFGFCGINPGEKGFVSISIPWDAWDASEFILLLESNFPDKEWFGSWEYTLPLDRLTEPERAYIELNYLDGTSDRMIPLDIESNSYGFRHGVGLYSIKPTHGKATLRIRLVNNMSNASFVFLGITAKRGAIVFPDPPTSAPWYPRPRKVSLSEATFKFDTSRGLQWGSISSAMLPGGEIELRGSPVFVLQVGSKRIPSTEWNVTATRETARGIEITTEYQIAGTRLVATLSVEKTAINEIVLGLSMRNLFGPAVTGTLIFPFIEGLSIGDIENTWYIYPRDGAVINRVPCKWRDHIGSYHPMQFDGFFNPEAGVGISFAVRDTSELFRYYNLEKNARGCSWWLEYLPRTVSAGGEWESVPVAITVIPGDWKDQFEEYKKWLRSFYKPLVPRKQWFREAFVFGVVGPGDFLDKINWIKEAYGYCDYLHCSQYWQNSDYGWFGDYDHYEPVGGKDGFINQIREVQQSGVPFGFYVDLYLVSEKSLNVPRDKRKEWVVLDSQGKEVYPIDPKAMCLYQEGWLDYLCSVYSRLAREIKPDGLYIDEGGSNFLSRTCWNPNHGHPVPMGMSPGETNAMKRIREAVPPEIVLYTEMGATDIMTQYIDGSFSYMPWWGYKPTPWITDHVSYEEVAPQYLNLRRFLVPDFKNIYLFDEVPAKNGNMWLARTVFFNADAWYAHAGASRWMDGEAKAFFQKMFKLLHDYKDCFTSDDVEPMVYTEVPNLFANRFSGRARTVYTLYNAGYRTLSGGLLSVPHRDGVSYYDAWNDKPINVVATTDDGRDILLIEIGPRSLGCIVCQSTLD